MAMKFSEAKQYVLTQEPTFLQRARNINGRHSFVCPCCGNGSGSSGTGITVNPYSNPEHPYYKCFKCGEGGDVINLAMNQTGYGFKRAVQYLCDEYGVEVEGYEGSPDKRNDVVRIDRRALLERMDEPPKVSQLEYFRRCEESLDPRYLEERGLSIETQRHYHVGTDHEWVNPVVAERYRGDIPSYLKSPRCIIPTSEFSYLARDVRQDLDERAKKYQKVKFGRVRLFSKDEAYASQVFVVTEGEIDAMSIYEASESNIPGLGLGSAANWRILVSDMKERGIKPQLVVLALDNDEAGDKARGQLEDALKEMGVPTAQLAYDGKDPNEALKNSKENLSKALWEAVDCAYEKEVER